MHCVIINGSPSKQYQWGGNITTSYTGKLVEEVKKAMTKCGTVSFEEIRLADITLPYCVGCHTCFYKGEQACPHTRIIQPIVATLHTADCVILTSPVYALHVSGLMKSFLDLTAYNFHRPSFFGKKALVVSATAGAGAKKVCQYLQSTLHHWGFNKVYRLPVIRGGATALDSRTVDACYKVAKQFYDDTASKRLHSPTFEDVLFYQLWRAMSLKTPGADQTYWASSGLVNHDFAPPQTLGLIKRLWGRMIFGMFQKVMK